MTQYVIEDDFKLVLQISPQLGKVTLFDAGHGTHGLIHAWPALY